MDHSGRLTITSDNVTVNQIMAKPTMSKSVAACQPA
jgi:hypothetical protein